LIQLSNPFIAYFEPVLGAHRSLFRFQRPGLCRDIFDSLRKLEPHSRRSHTFAIDHHLPPTPMSAEGSSKLRKRDRFRQYLPSRLGRNSLSNASISSANEGNGASTPPESLSSAQHAGQGPKDNLKPRKRDRFLGFFGKPSSDRPPTPKPFQRTTLDKDLAALSTTYLMEDCHNVKALILAIVTLSSNCKNEKVSLIWS
jgi:hypothetical protein